MSYKRKADCTPEEWEEYLNKKLAYRHANIERIRDYDKEWHKKNRELHPEKEKQYKKDYHKRHYVRWKDLPDSEREAIKEYRKEWREKNIEKVRQYDKKTKQKNRDKILLKQRERNKIAWKTNKDKLREEQKKRLNAKARFSTYAHRLTIDEDPIDDGYGYLKVRDFYTKEYFYPRLIDVLNRIQCLEGKNRGVGHIYKSNESKKACSLYNRKKYPKDKAPRRHTISARDSAWRDMVISRAEGHCERCGKECDSLIAHHKVPVASCTMMAADIDNGMALCPECHREVHSTDGCRLHELAAEKRETA